MGRRAATALHLALFLFGVALYVVFVLPRWWVLTGGVPATLATVGRIVAALPIGAAAVPVWMTLQHSMRPGARTPELALRLRAWSAVLHVAAAVLILLAAIAEIWLSLEAGGPWLFGVYGGAGAIAVLAFAAFYLSFTAEKPPAPPKPPKATKVKTPKTKTPKTKAGRGKKDSAAAPEPDATAETDVATPEAAGEDSAEDDEALERDDTIETDSDDETDVLVETETAGNDDGEPAESAETETDSDGETGGLRNKRPSGKRRHRLRR